MCDWSLQLFLVTNNITTKTPLIASDKLHITLVANDNELMMKEKINGHYEKMG